MIYQILPAYFEYKSFHFSEECINRHYKRAQEAKQFGNGNSLIHIYDKLEVIWYDDPDRKTPDITELDGNLVFNQKAMSALKSLLPDNIEAIPFKLDGEIWTIINLLQPMDGELAEIPDDNTLMIAEYDPTHNAVIRFTNEANLPKLFFITAANRRFYCLDAFKVAVQKAGLTGIVITDNLVIKDYELV